MAHLHPLLRAALGGAVLFTVLLAFAAEPPRTGPETEKRFPPLKVPPGFKATLFACDPLIEYPSVIAAGPRPNAVFVAADYMTGLGTEIVRRDEVRLVEDTDGDGYADKSTVFAGGFNSIQGLAYHDGTVFVMHAPYLTALRDTKGTGVADERRDLLTGLGLTPEQNPGRLHCANGVVVGHDGWLYLALGDHGCDVQRPEGDRLVLQGGGILRCRPDGRDLHVFATGLRNIYDIALDEDLNVFVRDNENDGGTYMIRVCHSFFGADHGYPYLYEERPDEALPPLADLGLGSSAGGACYLERQFPPEYRGNLFFCEWGRSVVRYAPQRKGSGFAPLKEIEFAAGAENDPYGFKPTDIVVQSDGSMLISDWADGQRPKRGRGRIYHIAAVGAKVPAPLKGDGLERWIAQLDSESYAERCQAQLEIKRREAKDRRAVIDALGTKKLGVHARLHAVWLLTGSPRGTWYVMDLARTDPEPRVRIQAIRALTDYFDMELSAHRLNPPPGNLEMMADRVVACATGQGDPVKLEVVVALGRLRMDTAPDWLRKHLGTPDAALAHAAMQSLRRCGNWPAVLKLLDESEPLHGIARRALAEQYEPVVVDGLIDRLRTEKDPARRREYADLLTRVCHKHGPWVYWGFRPAPRPANTVAWEKTDAIGKALDRVLTDPDATVRLTVLKRMQREKIAVALATLAPWLREERDPERMAVLLQSLRDQPAADIRPLLETVIRSKEHTAANRLEAFTLFTQGLDEAKATALLTLANDLEDGPVLAAVLRRMGKHPKLASTPLLLRKLISPEAPVRAAAVEALAELRVTEAGEPLRKLLDDTDADVRRAAATAVGRLAVKSAVDSLLKLARDPDAAVRRASLESLRLLQEARAVPLAVAALADRQTTLPALEYLGERGGPDQAAAVAELAKHTPSVEVLTAAVRVLTAWQGKQGINPEKQRELDRAIAQVHGASGLLLRWNVKGPMPAEDVAPLTAQKELGTGWRAVFATGPESRLNLGPAKETEKGVWLASTDLVVADALPVEFLASSGGTLQVWLNGKSLHRRERAGAFQIDSDRFAATLLPGVNRLFVAAGSFAGNREFHLRFRRKSRSAEHEKLTQAALARPGNAALGRKVFLDAEKSLCLKCHRLGDQGERIGPELTGIGSRFARAYIIESVLEPSRTIAPSFGSLTVSLKNGKVVTGVKVAETEATLTLADNQAQKHELKKADIDEQQPSPVSTMPEGLEKRLTPEEFVDLIAFLVSQREARPR